MVTAPPAPPVRSAAATLCRLHLIRLSVLALLAGAALASVWLSRAVPGTPTAVLEVVVVAYAVLAAVPLWLVMGRMIGTVAEQAAPRASEQVVSLAPVIPLHGWRPKVG